MSDKYDLADDLRTDQTLLDVRRWDVTVHTDALMSHPRRSGSKPRAYGADRKGHCKRGVGKGGERWEKRGLKCIYNILGRSIERLSLIHI